MNWNSEIRWPKSEGGIDAAKPLECGDSSPLSAGDLSPSNKVGWTILEKMLAAGVLSRRSARCCLADQSAKQRKRRQVAALQSPAGACFAVFQHALTLLILCGGLLRAGAQLPADFPRIVVSNYNPAAVSPGCVFLAVASELPGGGAYLMIVTNNGSIVWHEKLAVPGIYDFKALPNGYLACAPFITAHSWTDGGDAVHQIRDENYALRETITGGNGYVAESHDFQMLPNGNVLQFGYYLSEVDMSQLVPSGHPAALVSGGVVQELDAQRNVIFQWRSWDHYPFAGNVAGTNAVIDAFHLNTIDRDTDGHILIATPQGVKKLNRQTGEILWHLGGAENQFTFVGVTPQEGTNSFGGHNFNRLPNGNVLIYDNGSRDPAGAPSKVHEYQLNEIPKVATRVWTYTSSPAIQATHGGSAQRLANGNTFIGWGGASGDKIPTCTEVTPAGQKVFEIYFTNSLVESYRAFRFNWPPTNKLEFTKSDLATGNTYVFTNTGVSLEVLDGGGGYNEFTVTRQPYAPVDPVFQETAPRVLPVRVRMIATAIPALTATVSFDALSFGFSQPTNLTIYYRAQAGQGSFIAQPTDYNPLTHALRTTLTMSSTADEMGEFIFGYPDSPDVAFAPLLAKPENYRGIQTREVIAPSLATTGVVYTVNQQRPISLSWLPKGMARWFELEIATNQAFTTPIIAVPYQTVAYYLWSNALPNTAYFYRVKTWNDAGASGWSTGAFQTVAPAIQVTAPNGSEAWRRGVKHFIRWNDNLAEGVVIDLYKAGAFLKSLNTNSSAGAYEWEAGLDLLPASDYAIRIRSATNAALFDTSDANFSIIDAPTIIASSVTRLLDGRVQFSLTAPGADQATVFGSTNFTAWQALQTVTVTNGSAVFTDAMAATFASRWYRLRVP